MKIATIYRPEVFSIGSRASLSEAASRMQFNEVGALTVSDGERFIGIVTERDLTRAMAEGADPESTPVRRYMSEDPQVVSPETDARWAAAAMLDLGVRHLPVLVGEQVVGMISVRDLLVDLGAAGEEAGS